MLAALPAGFGLLAWGMAPGMRFHLGVAWVIAAVLPFMTCSHVPAAIVQIIVAAAVGSMGVERWGEAVALALVLAVWGVANFALAHVSRLAGLAGEIGRWVMAVIWMTFPVWIGDHATEWMARWLLPVHPLVALNGAAPSLGIWTEFPLVYRWTAWGQDLPAPVSGMGWFVAAHLALAAAIWTAGLMASSWRQGGGARPGGRRA